MAYRDDLDAARARHAALVRELSEVRERLGDREVLAARERQLATQLADVGRQVDHARARVQLPLLANVRVASPCRESWDAMTGDERQRHCARCDKDVFDLSAMTATEAEAFLAANAAACVRFYRRADGTVMTSDCPDGARRRTRRRVGVAGAAIALAASAAGVATRWIGRDQPATHGREVMGELAEPPVMGNIAGPVDMGLIAPSPPPPVPIEAVLGQVVAPSVPQPEPRPRYTGRR